MPKRIEDSFYILNTIRNSKQNLEDVQKNARIRIISRSIIISTVIVLLSHEFKVFLTHKNLKICNEMLYEILKEWSRDDERQLFNFDFMEESEMTLEKEKDFGLNAGDSDNQFDINLIYSSRLKIRKF